MASRQSTSTSSQAKVEKIGRAAAQLHRLLKELGHAKGLEQSAATMPDARERLTFIDQTMHEASEKVISAVESSLPLTDKTKAACGDIAVRLSDDPALSRHALIQEAISRFGEVASSSEAIHHNLLQIMEAQEFRDVAGQMVNKIVDAAVEIEKILLELLCEYSPEARDSLIHTEGLTAGPTFKTSADNVTGQDEVDDLLASLGF
jgi:chemotaxis protein CheZ